MYVEKVVVNIDTYSYIRAANSGTDRDRRLPSARSPKKKRDLNAVRREYRWEKNGYDTNRSETKIKLVIKAIKNGQWLISRWKYQFSCDH